jgi:hypothetical protein
MVCFLLSLLINKNHTIEKGVSVKHIGLSNAFRAGLFLIFFIASAINAQDAWNSKPFSGKLFFAETPNIGLKWHGGIRMTDILAWDGYININNWMTLDLLAEGMSEMKADKNGSTITDKFRAIALKSRPFSFSLKGNPYQLAFGLKLYRSNLLFSMKNDMNGFDTIKTADTSTVLFLTESYSLGQKHFINLFTSLSFRRGSSAYFIVPGYRYGITGSWSVGIEYYMTNSIFLPLGLYQYLFSANHWALENYNQDLFSFMFYGFQYTGKHLRIDLNIGNHISFQPPFLPLLGVGWNF